MENTAVLVASRVWRGYCEAWSPLLLYTVQRRNISRAWRN